MITNIADMLTKARTGGYAVGAFNTINLEFTRAIIEAAVDMKSPVIVQITEKTMEYAGGRAIFHLVKNIAEFYGANVPIGIHLDHGKSFEAIRRAVEIGFPSVMYDGSRRAYADNNSMTKQITEYCHERAVVVQAELGNVPYIGEIDPQHVSWKQYMTDPAQAQEFVAATGIDTLAIAIGNAHGFVQERSEPDYARLRDIAQRVAAPLVLHGASDWDDGRVKNVIADGVACFNVDTKSRVAFLTTLAKQLTDEGESPSFDVRKLLGHAQNAVKEVVAEKMALFGSVGKA